MSSIVEGYEYDIFISYRQKDNRVGKWVTNFVQALNAELDATFKEDISIYFDENPGDGLLETHDVDKSLESKLKSLIFIPIISQTYCDPNCYAWQHEFCAFNNASQQDQFGRDIKLGSGNVASRILPVTIHDLDSDDRQLIEDELKAKFRFIEFIFRSPGVNRALRADEMREDNMNRLSYRDQINKVANAIKEITKALRNPKSGHSAGNQQKQESDFLTQGVSDLPNMDSKMDGKSIAVLPFVSLARDESQDYFTDGITENILIELASLHELRVISRTSVMAYKNTTKSAPDIAEELGVKYILEGSAQSHASKVKINVRLVDAAKDSHIWSKVFVEDMDDIFTLQSKVAEVVATKLQSSLNPQQNGVSKDAPTKDLEAYDLFLRGRHSFNQWNMEGYRIASDYFKEAIEKDPEFKLAYSYMASSYSARMSWNGDLSPKEAKPHIDKYLDEAWKRGATDNDFLTKAFVEFFISKDFDACEKMLLKVIELNSNNATALYTYSYLLGLSGKFEKARACIENAELIEPNSVAYFNSQGIHLYLTEKYNDAILVLKAGMKKFPHVLRFSDHLCRIYLTMGLFKEAVKTILAGFSGADIRPPSMVAYLAEAYWHLKENKKSDEMVSELLLRAEQKEKGVNYYLSHVYHAKGDHSNASQFLKQAKIQNDIGLIWHEIDPLLKESNQKLEVSPRQEKIQEQGQAQNTNNDYSGAEKFIISKLEAGLSSKLTYHNVAHTKGVLESAMRIAKSEEVPEHDKSLLRLAALFHDSGYIKSYKDHEERSCELVKEYLPTYGVSGNDIDTICGMIMATKIPQAPETELQKILCDADLDYLGRNDFVDLGKQLFIEMKNLNLIKNEKEWNRQQKYFLSSHRYHTSFSIKNREVLKRQNLLEVTLMVQM